MTLILSMSSCAHKTKVQPSKGHIDGQSPTSNSVANKPASDTAAAGTIPKPVTNTPYLPPPKPKAKEPVYSIVVYDTPVKEVLFAIARDSKLNVDIHPSIQGRVTLNAVDQTLPAILERLSRQVDLTYKIQGNVLTITPDQPVLRTYKVDYVNMSRDTKGFIGADGQISSASQSSGTGGTMSSTSGNGANNSSRTSVNSESKNHLWESLIQNIKDLLQETDKEVMIARYGNNATATNQTKDSSAGNSNSTASQAELNRAATEQRNQEQIEYKTRFAANVIANAETGIISVRATNRQHEKVQEFIDRVMNSAKRQVLIEATIVEVSLKDGFQAGIDWSRFGNNPKRNAGFQFQQSLGATIDAASTGFSVGYLNPASGLGSIASSITLLQQFGDTKVLSSPKLMVLNNQTAVLKVVDNLVYFTVQVQNNLVTNAGSSDTITTTPNIVPVGVVMSVTPQISDSNVVNINVRPTISRKIDDVDDPNPKLIGLKIPSRVPVIQVREMESLLQVNSGSTAVLGGLMEDTVQRNSDRVPGLADVPGVGNVFRGRDDLTKKTELVIFLRPTVISNASLESDELATYKQYLPSQQLEQVLEADGER